MRESSRPAECQVNGCGVALSKADNRYCWKKRACLDCLKAPIVSIGDSDVEQRFCQQCGRFEPLSLFDGDKRSCRKGLERRRATDRRRQAAAATTPHFGMPGAHQGCFCAGCSSAAANFQIAAAFQQQQQHAAAMWGCSGFPIAAPAAAVAEEAFAAAPAAATKRQKLSHSSSTITDSRNTAALLNHEKPWAAQQQQQQGAAAADGDMLAMLQAFQTDHLQEWVTAELEADCALEQQLQQLQQQSAASALMANTGVTNNNNNMMPVSYLPPVVAGTVWRMDSDTGSSGSSARTASAPTNMPAAAAPPAATAADADTVLDGLLDVLCNELQARAAPSAPGFSFPTVSQQINNSPALSAATGGAVPPAAAAAAAAAGCADIRTALNSIKAELQHVTASLVGHTAAAAAAAAAAQAVSGAAQMMPAMQMQLPAATAAAVNSAAGVAVAHRLEMLQQQMGMLSGHMAQMRAMQSAGRWDAA